MGETMKAVVNYAPEPGSVELREVPVPTIGPEDVLLRVKAVGICGSDLHQFHGRQSWTVNHPVILGHEFGGRIEQVGGRVTGWRVGDRVVSETAAVIDANSSFAREGNYHLDPSRQGFGYGVDGAMAEYASVPARCLHRIPDGLAYETAALTEPCCVAYNAACVQAALQPGQSVAVIGPGPIGLLCAMMARLAGAGQVAVIGIPADAQRLAVAKQIGMDVALGAKGEDPLDWGRSLGDGQGIDVVIDAAGVSATLKMAMALVRPAGRIVKVGWGPQPLEFSLDPLVQKAVTLQGSFSHNWPMWERVLTLLGTGRLDLQPVLNRVAPLADWRESFDTMSSGAIVKGVLQP